MTTCGAWLQMLLLLLWLTFGAVVSSGTSVMASWTDVHCVTYRRLFILVGLR